MLVIKITVKPESLKIQDPCSNYPQNEKFLPKLSTLLLCYGKGYRSKNIKFIALIQEPFFFWLIRLLGNRKK
jgi:hypothetical protein